MIAKVNSLFKLLNSSSQKINDDSAEAKTLKNKIETKINDLKSFDLNFIYEMTKDLIDKNEE